MKKPLRDHISALLSSSEGPMGLKEITAAIQARGEFTFKTASPDSVVRNALRRGSAKTGDNQAAAAIFQQEADGKWSMRKA